MKEFLKYALIVLGTFFTAWGIKPTETKESSLNDSLFILNQKIDSIQSLIKREDNKIDSIYSKLNFTYEKIDTASNDVLHDIMRGLPTRTRH